MGLDLGQAADYTAISVLERKEAPRVARQEPIYRGGRLVGYENGPGRPEGPDSYDCGWAERLPLGTPYPQVIEQVREKLQTPKLRGHTALVVDATGVGRPVVDLLREGGLDPVAVTITGGDAESYVDRGWRVPKRNLVSVLQVLFQTKRLQIASGIPAVQTLTQELLNFKVKISDLGHDSYGAWREGQHDDLVLAVAVAAWWAEREPPPLDPSAFKTLRRQ